MKNKTIISMAIATMLSCPAFATGSGIGASAQSADCDNGVLGTYTGPASLSAQWTANTINLNFYDGENKLSSGQCTYDAGITLPNDPTKTGYEFAGWRVRSSAARMPFNRASMNTALSPNHYYGVATYLPGGNLDQAYFVCNIDTVNNAENCSTRSDLFGDPLNLRDKDGTYWVEFDNGMFEGKATCANYATPDVHYFVNNIQSVFTGNMSAENFIAGYSQVASQEKVAKLVDLYTKYLNGQISEQDFNVVMGAEFMTMPKDFQSSDVVATSNSYCFCNLTGYTPTNGPEQSVSTDFFIGEWWNNKIPECWHLCPYWCGANMKTETYRKEIFGQY